VVVEGKQLADTWGRAVKEEAMNEFGIGNIYYECKSSDTIIAPLDHGQ
jgi:hypothetical protein